MTAVYILLIIRVAGHLEVAEPIPFRGSPQLCSMSMYAEAILWIAEHEPGATIHRVQCREGRPA